MSTWQSSTIEVDGIYAQVRAGHDGVTFGNTVEGVYASDLILTPEQAVEIAEALTEGAAHCLAARGDA